MFPVGCTETRSNGNQRISISVIVEHLSYFNNITV